jgi:hypothetical protein
MFQEQNDCPWAKPVSNQQQKVLQGNIEIRSVNDRDDDIDHRTN